MHCRSRRGAPPLEVLVAGGVGSRTAAGDAVTPTPAVSRAILEFNAEHDAMADGIVVTPSHNHRATPVQSTTRRRVDPQIQR